LSTPKRHWDIDPTMLSTLLHVGLPSSLLLLQYLSRSTMSFVEFCGLMELGLRPSVVSKDEARDRAMLVLS
jgi:hypothetical protein